MDSVENLYILVFVHAMKTEHFLSFSSQLSRIFRCLAMCRFFLLT